MFSKYTEEKDAEVEETSTLVKRMEKSRQAEVVEKNLEKSLDPQTDISYVVVESL